jgi:hypothetical protein
MILAMLLLLTTIHLQPDYIKAEETDTFSPEITSASADPGTVGYGFNITIAPTVTDNQSGVNLVKVNITYPDNSYGNYTMNNTGGSNYEYVFSDTWQTGQYNYTIWSIDNANNSNFSSQYSFTVSAQGNVSVCTVKDIYGDNESINLTDPPGGEGSGGGSSSQTIGYELLYDNKVLHIWNKYDSYYFNTSSGIQLTNHYNEYWSHNVLMLGYYNNDVWNLIYRTDELSGFNKDIESDNETFVNVTLWKDLTYQGYDFRLAIRYHLGVYDNELTVIPYIKNIDQNDIPYILGFGWEMKDIQIDMTTSGDYINVNRTMHYLNQTLNNIYTNLSETEFYLMENITDTKTKSLYLKWNQSLTYKLQVKSREGQYNAPVTLFIKVGTLNADQEKYTKLFWYDAEQVTFYFDRYDNSEAWATNPGYMVDGNMVNFASTTVNGDVELCDGNNCSGTDLGTISAVELRVLSYHSSGQRDTILRPVFSGTTDGIEYRYVTIAPTVWSEWFDITYDPFAPQSWGWSDIVNLDCDVEAESDPWGPTFTLYCSKIELRVTYTPYNYDPVISSPAPVDGATGVCIQPVLNITVSDSDGDNMNISWLSNSSGSWQVFGTNSSVVNGTYHQIMNNSSENGKWWYWKVNVSDGTEYIESSVYKFYTGCESKIENTGSTDISGYLFMQVQCYSEPLDTWISADYTINETTLRTIKAGEQLSLDTVFNGIVNSDNLLYGNGTYRVYVALRDPKDNVLKWDDVSPVEGCSEFSVVRQNIHGWYKLFKGDGFGKKPKKTNFATRGTAIYKGELYIGTENHDLSLINLISIGFPAGTRITMANGNYKNIEDIESGDVVKAYDIDNDSYVDANVTIVYHTSDWTPDYYFKVNDQLSVSPKHLLNVNGTLMRAEDAKVGDYLTDVNCSNVTITSTVNMTERPSMLYNFGIALNGSEEPLLPNNLTYFAEDVQVYPWASENIWDDPLKDVFLDLISIAFFIFAFLVSLNSDGCEIWKYSYDDDHWTQLIGDKTEADLPSGFGDHRTASVGDMIEFDDKLYVGTYNRSGCEIWRYDGSSWEQVVGEETSTQGDNSAQGFGHICNYVAATMEVFNNILYVGTINFDWSDDGFCQIWRTADGENWEKVVDKGFRDEDGAPDDLKNAYLWDMEVFQDELYAGTFNIPLGAHQGGQIWKSDTGNPGDWEKVDLGNNEDGFGEKKNYGIRKLVKWGDDLYVGTATSVLQVFSDEAIEIWKYDGNGWECIVGDEPGHQDEWDDGFGDYYNKYAWSMDTAGNALWVGTVHHHLIPWPKSYGCEVWRYDGTELEPIVENVEGEKPNGFGEWWNRAARSMIEYPEGSGNIVVGTLTFKRLLEEQEGCEVWIRYP